MFKGQTIPKELRVNGLKQKLFDYLKNNPDKNFDLDIKVVNCDSDCVNKLIQYVDNLNESLGREAIIF